MIRNHRNNYFVIISKKTLNRLSAGRQHQALQGGGHQAELQDDLLVGLLAEELAQQQA